MAQPGIDFPGVGCGLVIRRDGKVLLYKRVKSPEAGHWSIVGGKVDHMEHALEAARREAEEESGLTIGNVTAPPAPSVPEHRSPQPMDNIGCRLST